jgi:hypothetical protein
VDSRLLYAFWFLLMQTRRTTSASGATGHALERRGSTCSRLRGFGVKLARESGEIIVADDEGEVLKDEDGNGRSDGCDFEPWMADRGLPCWYCYKSGFETPSPVEEDTKD